MGTQMFQLKEGYETKWKNQPNIARNRKS